METFVDYGIRVQVKDDDLVVTIVTGDEVTQHNSGFFIRSLYAIFMARWDADGKFSRAIRITPFQAVRVNTERGVTSKIFTVQIRYPINPDGEITAITLKDAVAAQIPEFPEGIAAIHQLPVFLWYSQGGKLLYTTATDPMLYKAK